MLEYAVLCGRILARAHARTGQPAMISGYLGGRDVFDAAIAELANVYADQAERDHELLTKAIRRGELPAELDV